MHVTMESDIGYVYARIMSRLQGRRQQYIKALGEVAQEWLDEAVQRTPMRPPPIGGSLRESGRIVRVDEGTIPSFRIVFGGPTAPYAVYVHEILENYHPVGQAKFLESVVVERAPRLAADIAAKLKEM